MLTQPDHSSPLSASTEVPVWRGIALTVLDGFHFRFRFRLWPLVSLAKRPALSVLGGCIPLTMG